MKGGGSASKSIFWFGFISELGEGFKGRVEILGRLQLRVMLRVHRAPRRGLAPGGASFQKSARRPSTYRNANP